MIKKLTVSTLFTVICLVMWIGSASAEKAADFSLGISKTESADSEFTIALKGSNITDLYAYEVKLKFDPNRLEVVKAKTTIAGFSVSPIVKGNEITFAHTKIGKVKGEKGNVELGTITFKTKKAGPAKLEWTSMILLDPEMKKQQLELTHKTAYLKLFKDTVNHWAKADIMEMVALEVIEGMDSDYFKPNDHVTRAQFATLLVRTLKLEEGAMNPFKDVKAGAWYEDTVKKALAAGLINGVSSTSFAPEKKITREEMSAMLMRAKAYMLKVKSDELESSAISQFEDAKGISSWAEKSVGFALQAGLMKGRTATEFAPKANATRAEAAVVMNRLLSDSQ